MSDNIRDLSKVYQKNVKEHGRRIGLFTIPEYPEFHAERGMWSTALDVILTTLRYLAPATLLTVFWGQQSFVFKLLKYIDSAFRSVLYSSDEQKQSVLQWLGEAGTVRVDKLETVWKHGWLVCGVLDIALPGTCAGHPPTKLSLKHAQSLAEEYLGVEPVFTRQELESIETLGKHQEWKLITFLDNIRSALAKSAQPATKKANTVRFSAESVHYTFDYIARGSGLAVAQIKNKATFNIYPTAQQSLDPKEINITIKGPKNAVGNTTIPAVLGKAQMIRQSLLGRKASTTYTKNVLPITQGTTYLRTYGKNDMSKTYFIPPAKYDIEIETEVDEDHVKVCYVADFEGQYEISIKSNNLHIAGSPFTVTASTNIVEILEKDNFYLEDGEEIDIVDVTNDRKVVLRIVDFVSEKMLLKENGSLEKISDDEAKQLMELDTIQKDLTPNAIDESQLESNQIKKDETNMPRKLVTVTNKIIIINRVCKAFRSFNSESVKEVNVPENKIRNNGDIPDVVNSTLNEYKKTSDLVAESCDRYIIPENITVSLLTEKPSKEDYTDVHEYDNFHEMCRKDFDKVFEDDTASVDTIQSSNNPFINDTYSNSYSTEKKFGSFIMSEYETNNSQNEELQNAGVKEVIDGNESNYQSTNPFQDDEASNNPFICNDELESSQQSPLTDFIIGAPVSITPNMITTSTETLNLQTTSVTASCRCTAEQNSDEPTDTSQGHLTNDPKNTSKTRLANISLSPKKEMWDSAYVSIDENNISDGNMQENSDEYVLEKQKNDIDISNIEPLHNFAMDNLQEVNETMLKEVDATKKIKQELKLFTFMPIQEECDRIETPLESFRSDYTIESEADSVTNAFAELDNIYDDYFSNSIADPKSINEDSEIQSLPDSCAMDIVDSASEIDADVKRHMMQPEGKISEVQANVTESVSVSQILQEEDIANSETNYNSPDETQFGNKMGSNIVLEKKIYWDEKIRQNEAKSDDYKSLKRRLSSKYLRRNDSLTKRRGKKIVKNFLNCNERDSEVCCISNHSDMESSPEQTPNELSHSKIKIKDSIKNYWDNRVHAIHSMESCFGKKCPKSKENSTSQDSIDGFEEEFSDDSKTQESIETKQELSEEVFKAFETSPKRFFGTSRQQILNKIDTFKGKSGDIDVINKNISEVNQGSGLVSSRISMFHNITKTEPLPMSYPKHKNLNISSEKVSIEKNFILKENPKSYNSEIKSSSLQIGNKIKIDKNANLIKDPIVNFQVEKSEDNDGLKKTTPTTSSEVIDHNINNNLGLVIEDKTEESSKDDLGNKSNDLSMKVYNSHNKKKNSLKENSLKSFSKSEMDIFNKSTTVEIDLDKHKSYEALPKISVRNFISLYEDVSKSAESDTKHRFQKKAQRASSTGGTAKDRQVETPVHRASEHRPRGNMKSSLLKDKSFESDTTNSSLDFEIISNQDKQASCLSLSDIDIEIIDGPEKDIEPVHKTDTNKDYTDYKSRFKLAKQYFQSLEDLRKDKNPRQINESVPVKEIYDESLEPSVKQKKNNKRKSNTMPSSEISKIWNQMQEEQENASNTKKLVKISEKFNVEDLYEDVTTGRLSRQGSLRGIPNKKAVLETFRSMENISNKNSYELATSQMSDFASENKIRNAQTYLSEYPYLPTTDPSKYHSRIDVSASGLITLKELKQAKKVRRNSVPDVRINPIFTEEL